MKNLILLLPVLLLFSISRAQVLHVNMQPDEVLQITGIEPENRIDQYEIEVPGFSSITFTVVYFTDVTPTTIVSGDVVGFQDQCAPIKFERGEQIHSGLHWFDGMNCPSRHISWGELQPADPWGGNRDGYIGFRVSIQTCVQQTSPPIVVCHKDYKYGWVRLSVGSDSKTLVIKDYAYENTINTPIVIGEGIVTSQKKGNQQSLNLQLSGKSLKIQDLRQNENYVIFDLHGRILMEGILYQDHAIDLSGLNSGLYMIKVAGSESIRSGKFLLNE